MNFLVVGTARRSLAQVSVFCVLALILSFQAWAADPIAILPASISLNGPEARQRLLVEQMRDGQFNGQITNGIQWRSSDPTVVQVENGIASPMKNGRATLRATVARRSVSVPVVVQGMDQPFKWSFRNHVQPVLARNGCSAGACHGAAAGQNGFKLSLRGYDDEGDFLTLTRGALGRRVTPSDPGRSLMLLKPPSAVPHNI